MSIASIGPHDEYRLADDQPDALHECWMGQIQTGRTAGVEVCRVGEKFRGEENGHDGQFVFRNLFHRPPPQLICVVAPRRASYPRHVVGGYTSGMLQENPSESRIGVLTSWCRRFGTDLIVMSGSFGPMPIKIGEKIHDLKSVQYVRPAFCIQHLGRSRNNLGNCPGRFLARFNGFRFHDRAPTCRGGKI